MHHHRASGRRRARYHPPPRHQPARKQLQSLHSLQQECGRSCIRFRCASSLGVGSTDRARVRCQGVWCWSRTLGRLCSDVGRQPLTSDWYPHAHARRQPETRDTLVPATAHGDVVAGRNNHPRHTKLSRMSVFQNVRGAAGGAADGAARRRKLLEGGPDLSVATLFGH